jgi:ribose 1,5-bisphosphokinase PhnN
LRSRGREDATAIDRRLARNGALPSLDADLVIQNDGELADAGRRLATFLSGSGR